MQYLIEKLNILCYTSKLQAYSKPYHASKIILFAKKLLTVFAKISVLDASGVLNTLLQVYSRFQSVNKDIQTKKSRFLFVFGFFLISCRIQSKCGKIRTRKDPNMDNFYAVNVSKNSFCLCKHCVNSLS